jgi:citrate lyase subunit beta/citryl-CoA lyase
MTVLSPDLRRAWLFGPGADACAHEAMQRSGADGLILDLEDFTPPERRAEARFVLASSIARWREAGCITAVRINGLDSEGFKDLEPAMRARADVIAYPMATRAAQMQALDLAICHFEKEVAIPLGQTEILPVCETALGVVNLRELAAATPRIRSALLGAEDLAADLQAERQPDARELEYARRRFVLECRAAGIEPIDAPYTFADSEGAAREASEARRLGYHSKAVVRCEHVAAVHRALTPDAAELARAKAIVLAFTSARERGEDRAFVDGLWVEVPTYRNAQRLLERERRRTEKR